MASSLTLLLVDDEVLITEMVHDALEDAGFAVISANDGDRAMAVLDDETHAICGIITDINMGDTADGWAVARRARELKSRLAGGLYDRRSGPRMGGARRAAKHIGQQAVRHGADHHRDRQPAQRRSAPCRKCLKIVSGRYETVRCPDGCLNESPSGRYDAEDIVPNPTTILVVDDEALIADMVCDALTDSGFEVVVANDGGEALSMIAMNPHIHALVTDINMGAGADGWHVARCAREACPCIPWSTRPVARRMSGSATVSMAVSLSSNRSTLTASFRR